MADINSSDLINFPPPPQPPTDQDNSDQFEDAVEACEAIEAIDETIEATEALELSSDSTEDDLSIQTLEQALEEVHQVLTGALDNQFQEALKIAQKRSSYSVYHSLGETVLHFLKAVLTLEKDQVERALQSASNLFELCGRAKRQHYLGLIWRPNYNSYTDEEAHAELCYAESLLMVALLTFLENQSLLNLVKGAFRIRSCYQAYKECQSIMNSRTQWQTERSRRDFEAGVRMGVGTFNLMCSHLPGKVLKVLEFIGFSGNRSIGLVEIERSVRMSDCLRSPISALISATYHCYIEHYFGLGDGDVHYVQQMLHAWLNKFPNSAFFLLFSGRLSVLKGELDRAIDNFSKCISIQDEWKQLHNICYWELLWCYCIKCDWHNAVKYADILREQCAWSPAIYQYQSAIFLAMIQDEAEDELTQLCNEGKMSDDQLKIKRSELNNRRQLINDLMRQVPNLRIRYAGKTIPAEKFAVTHAEKYFTAGNHLLLPAFEYIYIWNIFAIIEKDVSLVNPILARIEAKLKQYSYEEENEEESTDNLCLLYLLRGVCLRVLNRLTESKECFFSALRLEKRVKMATFISPHACMELGLTCLRTEELDEANVWFEKAKRDYTGYLLEMMVHFRVHCGQRVLKHINKKRLLQQKELEKQQANAAANEVKKSNNSIESTSADEGSSASDTLTDSNSDASSIDASSTSSIEQPLSSNQIKRSLASVPLARNDVKPTFLEQVEPVSTQL